MNISRWTAVLIAAGAAALSGCGSSPSVAPHYPTTTPASISVSPSSLSFAGISTAANGYAYDQTVTGTLSAASSVTVDAQSCLTPSGPIARVTNYSQSGLTVTATVSPLAAGRCTVTLTTASGSTASIAITVNDGSVGLSAAGRTR